MTNMLLHEEQIPLSDTFINRLVHGLPDPEQPPVRVLGVDDWAKNKGQRYDTILIDLERMSGGGHSVPKPFPQITGGNCMRWASGISC